MKIKFVYKIDIRNKTAYNEIAEKQSQAEGGGKHGRKSELRKDAAVYGRNVPVTEIARAMHKDAQYVRVGLQQGIFKFGYAVKLEGSNEYNYYCPDRKVWEEIGYFNPESHVG